MKISRDKSGRALFRDLGRSRIRELASQSADENRVPINYIVSHPLALSNATCRALKSRIYVIGVVNGARLC